MTAPGTHPDSAAILAALRLGPRPGLFVDPGLDETGHLVVLEEPAGPEDLGAHTVIGLAILGEAGWRLGCIACEQGIEEADPGMCGQCREAAGSAEQQYLAGQRLD